MENGAVTEIESGERFAFGANWRRFLASLDDERISEAEQSLKEMLCTADLHGQKFLDVGSGSGLFSLAARRLGATVHSFDYDPQSVACTQELKRRYFPADPDWTVEQGNALDEAYLSRLGQFDVVYAWGVLHHTGDMWRALGNMPQLVAPGGKLFIAIYNDQGGASRRWTTVKSTYNRAHLAVRMAIVALAGAYFFARSVAGRLARLENPLKMRYQDARAKQRGMSAWHDLLDWVGGYPFEVARPDEIFEFYRQRGFTLVRLRTVGGGLGNNEYVFWRDAPPMRA